MPREWTKRAGYTLCHSHLSGATIKAPAGSKKGEAARADHMKHSTSVCLTIYCNLIHLAAFPEQESQGKYASS